MEKWIKDNSLKFEGREFIYLEDGIGYTRMHYTMSSYEKDEFSDPILDDDRKEFNAAISEIGSKIYVRSHILDCNFKQHLMKKYLKPQSVGPENYREVYAEPLKILSASIKQYLDKMSNDFHVESYTRGFSWTRGSKSHGRTFALSINEFCKLSISYGYKHYTIATPQLGTFAMKGSLTNTETILKSISEHTENISLFLKIMTNKKYNNYITKCLDNKCIIDSSMQVSNFKKLITFMNEIPVDDAIEYSEVVKYREGYADNEAIEVMDDMLLKIDKLRIKQLASFAVTVHGVQFKVTNISGARIKRTSYKRAYRFQVCTNFLTKSVSDIMNMDADKYEIRDDMLRFYKSLKILNAEKQFGDKLKMAALASL